MPSEQALPSELLSEVLKSKDGNVVSFLQEVFEFLATRTNFYQVSTCEELGYPPGIAEKIIAEMFRFCDPYKQYHRENIFLPATVAEEVEICTYEDHDIDAFSVEIINDAENTHSSPDVINEASSVNNSNECVDSSTENINFESLNINSNSENHFDSNTPNENEIVSNPSTSKKETTEESTKVENSESFNGATRDSYSWSQNICELDVTVVIPEGIVSKQLKVNITANSICVQYRSNNELISLIDDKLTQKIKPAETLWVMSEGRVRIHLEKQIERWWDSLIIGEPKLDTSQLNCSRPLHELPEEHLAKVRELQFNHSQRLAGLPTSDDIQKEEILRKAWNLPGSPFANQPFDPNVFNP